MVTVLRAQGFRFVIFVNDHVPAHVHAFGDGEAKIDLSGNAPILLWAVGMTRADVRNVMAIARAHREMRSKVGRQSMADLTDDEIDAALARGSAARDSEPRACAARYDGERIVVTLANGCVFAFPPRSAQGLETASADELAAVEILGAGTGLHWEAIDVDLSVPDLLAGCFGTMSFMARRAGRVRTPRKAAAARANGAKGGRPRTTALR